MTSVSLPAHPIFGRLRALATTVILVFSLLAGLSVEAGATNCANSQNALVVGRAFIVAAREQSPHAFAQALRLHTNLDSIALFALGRHRSELPQSKHNEFVNKTGDYIAKTLADFSRKFRANEIRFVNCRGPIVETELLQLGGRPPQKVLWRFKAGKVTDVNIQNIWLAQLLRSNFNSVINDGGGFDALWNELAAS